MGYPVAYSLSECIDELVKRAHGAAFDAGWWQNEKLGLDFKQVINNPKNELEELLGSALVARCLCLQHSEISEAMEGHRKNLMDDKLPHGARS